MSKKRFHRVVVVAVKTDQNVFGLGRGKPKATPFQAGAGFAQAVTAKLVQTMTDRTAGEARDRLAGHSMSPWATGAIPGSLLSALAGSLSSGESSLSFGSSAERALLVLMERHEAELRELTQAEGRWDATLDARIAALAGRMRESTLAPGPAVRDRPSPSSAAATPTSAAKRPRVESSVFHVPVRARTATGATTLPDEAVRALMDWFVENLADPYPSAAQKQELERNTGLSKEQLRNWLTNMRKRHWNPLRRGRAPRNELEARLFEVGRALGLLDNADEEDE